MKIWATALLLPIAVFAQSTLLYQALPGAVTPDLVLLISTFAGLAWGAAGGSAAGLWGGVLVGAARGGLSLPMAFAYGLVGWLAGLHGERTRDRWTFPLVGAALAGILTALDCQSSSYILGVAPSLDQMMSSTAWASVACLPLMFLRR